MKRRAMWPLFIVVLGLVLAACGGGGSGGSGGYNVSGTLLDAEEQPLEGVKLTFSGMTATAETDEEGKWSQAGLKGSVTVTPVLDGYVFEPESVEVSSAAQDVDFIATKSGNGEPEPKDPEDPKPEPEPAYVVSGMITDEGDNPVADVTLEFSGLDTAVQSDEDGGWTSPELQGEVTVTPRLTGYKFEPKEHTVSAASDALHFEAIAVHPVSGVVEDEDGLPVGDVTITLRSGDGSERRTVTTQSDGTWRVDDVAGTVIVKVSDPAYVFDEAERTVSAEADDVDFKGTLQACSAGDPNNDTPCVLTRIKQVQNINDNLEGHYALGANIDASETFHWNAGEGFEPIGAFGDDPALDEPFVGTFAGNGYVIDELYINRPDEHFVGLFSYVGEHGTLTDVHIVGGSIVGGETTGAIAGRLDGLLDNGANYAFVGTPEHIVGGLLGANGGNVTNSNNYGHIEGAGLVAGLVGANAGTIEHSHNDSSALVKANGGGAGGVAGWNSSALGRATIRHSSNSGSVIADANAGGISAVNEGVISDSENFGDVTVTISGAGGIVGDNTYHVERVKNHGTVTAYGQFEDLDDDALMLFGVGGITGQTRHMLTEAANFGDVIAEGDAEDVGGLVGLLDKGTVTLSYNTATITSDGDNVGGLVGSAIDSAEVKYSFNEGDVDAGGDRVGGLAGRSFASVIHNSYNLGTVRGEEYVGGLVGENGESNGDGTELHRSYSAGHLSGRSRDTRGGLVGKATGNSVRGSFFDKINAAPVHAADGATSPDDMKKRATFVAAGWDFQETWDIDEGSDYPVLRQNRP